MVLQKPVILFPSINKPLSLRQKPTATLAEQVAVIAPRKGTPAGISEPFKKGSSKKLLLVRDAIGTLFQDAKIFQEWKDSVKANRLMNDDIVKEKFGSYDEEFAQLHKAVQDAFRLAGRPDLADSFGVTVPRYNSNLHPIDYIATLLKGASNPVSVAVQNDQYKVLEPFKSMMQESLINKGVAAPNEMAALTQVFYNTFVAKPGTENEVMNFDEIHPSTMYHADEAVVNGVLSFVKTLADKKKNGETLSPVQDKIANIGLKVEAGVVKGATDEVNKAVGEKITSNSKTILIVLGVLAAVVLYLAFRNR